MLKESDRAKFVEAWRAWASGTDGGMIGLWEAMRTAGLVEPAPLEPGDYEVFWQSGRRRVSRWDGRRWHHWSGKLAHWEPIIDNVPTRIGRRLPDET